MSVSGTDLEKAVPSIPVVARSKSHRLPPLPPPPPPHDDNDYNPQTLQNVDRTTLEKSHTLPPLPPPPPSKSFYISDKFSRNLSPAFLEDFMSRHPKISRHRRRFAALLFTIAILFILMIVLLAILLSRKDLDGNGISSGGSSGSSSGSSGGLNYIGSDQSASVAELKKHNQGISEAPINHSDAPGWTQSGSGDATYYDPSIKNSIGQFQEGACQYPYINSVYDMIAALNKPDFGDFATISQSPACGQCLQVTGPSGTIQVQVVDMCPGCTTGSLDLTPGAFAKIANIDQGRVPITWMRCP
ncbi:hypothetical protein BGZ49_002792 [Haplosporangium sp. Z 27]|nr:hypothetical protein BGZ49_002792 [Haplosporangium sp. Z 27]